MMQSDVEGAQDLFDKLTEAAMTIVKDPSSGLLLQSYPDQALARSRQA